MLTVQADKPTRRYTGVGPFSIVLTTHNLATKERRKGEKLGAMLVEVIGTRADGSSVGGVQPGHPQEAGGPLLTAGHCPHSSSEHGASTRTMSPRSPILYSSFSGSDFPSSDFPTLMTTRGEVAYALVSSAR